MADEDVQEPEVTEDVTPEPVVEGDPQPLAPESSKGDADHTRFVREDMEYKQKLHEWNARKRSA